MSGTRATTAQFPRGSEWRRWDLHVHTPKSALNQQFGGDFDAYAKLLLERAVERKIAAIGITDYFTIDGYKALREIVDDDKRLEALVGADVGAAARRILLVPNVEFRARELIVTKQDAARVNFHVLLSPELTPKQIEEDFLHQLRFTAASSPSSTDHEAALTTSNLQELGARLKSEHPHFADRSDLAVGMMTAVVAHEDVTRVLTRQPLRFDRRYLFVVPADEDLSKIPWDGQGHQVRKVLLQKADMLFSPNPRTRAFALGQTHPSVSAFEAEFRSRKPCIHGSDAHAADALFEPATKRYLWLKADPTFDGLRQLLNEPASRVFIGEEPPSLRYVEDHPTKFLSSLSFHRTRPADPANRWFSGAVELNEGLVAIIGNKGSGKSALADVIGLVGNAHTQKDFSFLTASKFLAPRTGFGAMFDASLHWRSGESTRQRLDADVDLSVPELVQYLPQNHLETICTEIAGSGQRTAFDRELEAVIFSHVDPAERLGQGNLQGLLEFRTSEKAAAVKQLKSKLHDVNRTIVELERQGTPEHRRQLEASRDQLQRELEAHDKIKPAEVPAPGESDSADAEARRIHDELMSVVASIEELDQKIDEVDQQRQLVNRKLAAISRLRDRIANLRATVDRFYDDSVEDAAILEYDVRSSVVVSVDEGPLLDRAEKLEHEKTELSTAVDRKRDDSLSARRADLSKKAGSLRERLDEPSRRYEEYRHRVAQWSHRREEIVGTVERPGSLAALTAQIADLDAIPTRLEKERERRLELARGVYSVKTALLADYRALYGPVQDFIADHHVSKETHALQFSASIAVDGLVEELSAMIHHGRRGSFQGDKEGRAALEKLAASHDFATVGGVEAFLSELERSLTHDVRDASAAPTALADQLVQGATPEDVYDLVFGLEYLRPRFELLWRGKPVDQLSPGERGTLLLVFYLLIDRRDVPLVIDQPEENLDNQTIATLLVPAIKYAKERRQVVIVTHNPNLAVVCDADQVIHSSLDKPAGNTITYTSGSIEDAVVTQKIVDVLEGTKPAFDLRDAKYAVLDAG